MNRRISSFTLCFCLLSLAWNARGAEKDNAAANRPAPQASNRGLSREIETLFDEGFVAGGGRSQSVQKQVAAARLVAGDDPRLDYAYGLVLLKQARPKEARTQFEAAIKRPGAAYWPAWQALVWSLLSEKQYETGLQLLDEYVVLVSKADMEGAPLSPVTPEQRDAARWIGQVLASLEKTTEATKSVERLAESEEMVLRAFSGELDRELQAGRDAIRSRHEELTVKSDLAQQTAARKKEQKLTDQAVKVETVLGDVETKRKDNAKTTEEWKAWLDEQLTKIDKQVSELQRDYAFLEKQAQSISNSMTTVGREITALQLQANVAIRSPFGAQQMQQQLGQRQNQMAKYELEYNATQAKMFDLTQQANVVIQQRAEVVQKYEATTGKLVKQNAALEKWANGLNEKKKKLAKTAVKAKKGGGHAPAAPAFASYMKLDLEAEKKRVLDSFDTGSPN